MSIVVKRTTWKDRLVWIRWWPPMPYLLHRWDAVAEPGGHMYLEGRCAGFWKHSSAQAYADECNRP